MSISMSGSFQFHRRNRDLVRRSRGPAAGGGDESATAPIRVRSSATTNRFRAASSCCKLFLTHHLVTYLKNGHSLATWLNQSFSPLAIAHKMFTVSSKGLEAHLIVDVGC
ncbi:unnamed protein product [Urochloa humidicola]